MPIVDIYATLTNVANKVMAEREKYLELERTEASGKVQAGDETVDVPAEQLSQLKVRLTRQRTKVTQLANVVGAEVVYKP